jgi:hypothetical protein
MALGLVIRPALPSQCAPYTEPVGPKRGARSAYGFFGAQRLSRSLLASRRDLYDKGCGSPRLGTIGPPRWPSTTRQGRRLHNPCPRTSSSRTMPCTPLSVAAPKNDRSLARISIQTPVTIRARGNGWNASGGYLTAPEPSPSWVALTVGCMSPGYVWRDEGVLAHAEGRYVSGRAPSLTWWPRSSTPTGCPVLARVSSAAIRCQPDGRTRHL